MIRVACTALLKRIVAGRPAADNQSLLGGGDDVTSDVFGAIRDFVGIGQSYTVRKNGEPQFTIIVAEPGKLRLLVERYAQAYTTSTLLQNSSRQAGKTHARNELQNALYDLAKALGDDFLSDASTKPSR